MALIDLAVNIPFDQGSFICSANLVIYLFIFFSFFFSLLFIKCKNHRLSQLQWIPWSARSSLCCEAFTMQFTCQLLRQYCVQRLFLSRFLYSSPVASSFWIKWLCHNPINSRFRAAPTHFKLPWNTKARHLTFWCQAREGHSMNLIFYVFLERVYIKCPQAGG